MLPLLQGDKETFENYYRKQRKKQARLVLQPQGNMVSSSTHCALGLLSVRLLKYLLST